MKICGLQVPFTKDEPPKLFGVGGELVGRSLIHLSALTAATVIGAVTVYAQFLFLQTTAVRLTPIALGGLNGWVNAQATGPERIKALAMIMVPAGGLVVSTAVNPLWTIWKVSSPFLWLMAVGTKTTSGMTYRAVENGVRALLTNANVI